MKIYIIFYAFKFPLKKFHTKPDDGTRGRKEEVYV